MEKTLGTYRNIMMVIIILSAISTQAQDQFEKHIIDANFEGPAGIWAEDIDNDGYLDVLAAGLDNNQIAWWKHDGNNPPSWTKHIIGEDFLEAIYVSCADINNDGRMDVLGAAWIGDEIAWWSNGLGTIQPWTKYVVDDNFGQAHEVMAYDVDLDGDIDILGASAEDNMIALYENNGENPPQFTKHIVDDNCIGARSVDAGDIDGDGDIDLVSAALGSNEVIWYKNENTNPIQFTKIVIGTSFGYSHKVVLKDYNEDGFLDILSTAYQNGIRWIENIPGDSTQWERHLVNSSGSATIGHPIDINLDGHLDIVCTYQGSNRIRLYKNKGLGDLSYESITIDANINEVWPLYYGDIDNDQDLDLICGARGGNEVVWYENKSVYVGMERSTIKKQEIDVYQSDSNQLSIKFQNHKAEAFNINISDITGKTIYTSQIELGTSGVHIHKINLDALNMPVTSMCLVRLTSNNISVCKKLILN